MPRLFLWLQPRHPEHRKLRLKFQFDSQVWKQRRSIILFCLMSKVLFINCLQFSFNIAHVLQLQVTSVYSNPIFPSRKVSKDAKFLSGRRWCISWAAVEYQSTPSMSSHLNLVMIISDSSHQQCHAHKCVSRHHIQSQRQLLKESQCLESESPNQSQHGSKTLPRSSMPSAQTELLHACRHRRPSYTLQTSTVSLQSSRRIPYTSIHYSHYRSRKDWKSSVSHWCPTYMPTKHLHQGQRRWCNSQKVGVRAMIHQYMAISWNCPVYLDSGLYLYISSLVTTSILCILISIF